MRRRAIAVAATLAALVSFAGHGFAQQGQPQLPNLRPPPPAPIKPYQPVAVTPPAPLNDPGFVAFRKQLADVAAHKDRAALAKLVVAQNFFWVQDKDLADPNKSGIDNLAKAIGLDAKDGAGLGRSCAASPTSRRPPNLPHQKGVFCAPGRSRPSIRRRSRRSARRPRPIRRNGAIRSKPASKCTPRRKPNAPVVEKLGMNLVRVLPDSGQQGDANQPMFLHVALPDGKIRLCRCPSAVAARRRPDVLQPRMRAAGKLPAISAGMPRNSTMLPCTAIERRRRRGDNAVMMRLGRRSWASVTRWRGSARRCCA